MAPIVSEDYKRKKKQEILASALSCFAKKGFQASTIDDIVTHSGISKGAIYNYFKSKDEIYLELMNQETEEAFKELMSSIAKCNTAKEKLDLLFEIYLKVNPFEKIKKESRIVHYEFRLHCTHDEALIQLLRKRGKTFMLKMVVDIFKEGQETGEFNRELNLDIFGNMFWTMIDGVMLQTILYDQEYPYEQVLTEMKQMLLEKICN